MLDIVCACHNSGGIRMDITSVVTKGLISVVCAIIYRHAPKLEVIEDENREGKPLSRFCEYYYINTESQKIVGTVLKFNIGIRNKGDKNTVIKPLYEIDIKSLYNNKALRPTPTTNGSQTPTYYTPEGDEIILTLPIDCNDIDINCDSKWNKVRLSFGIDGLIITPDTRELDCTLKLHDYDNRKAKCKVKLIRGKVW
jgi:hypothetical protein